MLSPEGSWATLSIMISASWPSALQTSTHSAQPLQCWGSTKIPNMAGSMPLRAGTSAYFLVRTKCELAVSAVRAPSARFHANAPIAGSSCVSGTATARMAVSGQALTHAMQPTHCSAMNSGMCAERLLKSRTAAVPGGMMLRATPESAGSSTSAMPRR